MQQKNIRARLLVTALGRNKKGIAMSNMGMRFYLYFGATDLNPTNLAGELESISIELDVALKAAVV